MAPSYNAESLFRVDGLVAVVTGGGSGLGRIAAHALAANGAKAVYILGRREDALVRTESTSPLPNVIKHIVCDVTSKEALKAAADRVQSEVGYCDVVFANSGIVSADQGQTMSHAVDGALGIEELQSSLWHHSQDEFNKCFHVNVTGAYYTVIAFLGLLDEGNKRAVVPQKSQVILTSSAGSFARPAKSGIAYGASKAAVNQMAKQLSTILAQFQIRVNVVAPGFYPSEMTEGIQTDRDPREEGSLSQDLVPLRKMGTEEDFGGSILYLVSKAGSYVVGNVLLLDGGRLSIMPATY